ncbi:MAG: cysteine hydrolase [Variovorax sp.]|nr:MAG: cysteine hydrolase [Variovorax sp.]
MSPSSQPAPIAPDTAAGGTALLIVDMISCWDFPDADKLLPGARRIAAPIAALKARCRRAGVPAIYANDNRGRWRSDFPALVDLSLECGGPAAAMTRTLEPEREDYFVLKPSQSAFFGTPLELLLQHLEVHRIAITGVASDQCVLSTVLEARMRSLDVIVPHDCVATQSTSRNRAALRQLEEVHRVPTTAGSRIRLVARPSP